MTDNITLRERKQFTVPKKFDETKIPAKDILVCYCLHYKFEHKYDILSGRYMSCKIEKCPCMMYYQIRQQGFLKDWNKYLMNYGITVDRI